MKTKKLKPLTEEQLELKKRCESSLKAFIEYVDPKRCLGDIHGRAINWWCRDGAKSHQLLLLPRDHMKSYLVACRAIWRLTKDPALRILYISSTANLAIKQLKFIKDVLFIFRM